ncbi:MAG: 30S ribosomal protein S2 [Dehalococcoidia bacterium]|nr:30S ribosomal protein S2 [Dehalococcoidia bacterium]NUQ54363.1 30S ribosomal protein S2 [Dehalococcoidia bacterium]RIL02125.1 MAG: 30S ribosomal protein S2 [bacterium]
MKQLLEAGVHFGHQTRRWNPKMRQFIFTERNGIHIIDLQQTVTRLEDAINFVRDVVAGGGEVLVIGTKKQARETVEIESSRATLPYVNNRWLGGTLTNFRTIQGRIRHLANLEGAVARGEFSRLTKKEQLDIANEIERLNRYFGGIKKMERLPAAVFIIDTVKEDIAVAECVRLGIPIVSLVDTNCDPDPVAYPIPSNDDAIRAIKLILGKMADAAIEGRAARESGVGAGVHGDEMARLAAEADAGLKAGAFSATPEEVAEAPAEASVTVISAEAQAAARAIEETGQE